MGKFIKAEMLMKPDWFLAGVYSDGVDVEKMELVMLANKQKFNSYIKKNDMSKLFEIIFHYLNLNTLLTDYKMYDERYFAIENNEALDILIADLRDKKNSGYALDALKVLNDHYLDILTRYLDVALNLFSKMKILVKNDNVHEYPDIFVLTNITSCDFFELWKMVYDADELLGSKIKKLADLNVSADNIKEYKSFIENYNKKTKETQISDHTVIGLEMDLAEDVKNMIYLIHDICMLNKLFYVKMKFEMFVLHRIQDTIKEKGIFPFKLTI